jgi:hypothetical protein
MDPGSYVSVIDRVGGISCMGISRMDNVGSVETVGSETISS